MSKASLAHHYEDPQETVIEPHRFMALTHYYVDRWLPELGERGHIIVTVLRRMGYLDRERDIERGGIEIEQDELAVLCGLSLRTLQREFAVDADGQPNNPALHLFVQREKQYHHNATGRIVREKTVYVVQMKDPVHPSDAEAVQEECAKREKPCSRQVGGNEVSRSRQDGGYDPACTRQVGGYETPRSRQVGARSRQVGACTRQVGGTTRQLGGYINRNLNTLNTLMTLNTPAALGDSLALFSEPETAAPSEPVPPPWDELTEEERLPYEEKAEKELIAKIGLKEWNAFRGPKVAPLPARQAFV